MKNLIILAILVLGIASCKNNAETEVDAANIDTTAVVTTTDTATCVAVADSTKADTLK